MSNDPSDNHDPARQVSTPTTPVPQTQLPPQSTPPSTASTSQPRMSARLAQQSVPQSELPKAKPRGKPWTSLPLLPLATGGDPLYFHLTKYKASALSTCQALLPTMQAAYGNMDSNEKSATMKAKCRLIARVCHPMPWVTAEGMWCPKKNMDSTMEAGSWPQWEVMECIKFSHQAVKSVKGLYMHGHYLIVNLGSADQSASPIKERAHRFLSSL